jgi:hypothetical protein
MKLKGPLRAAIFFCLTLSFFFTTKISYGQEIQDYAELKKLVGKWNDAINARSATTLKNLYGEKVLFYARDMKRSRAVLLKQDFWRKNPGYTQKIVSLLTFKKFSSGTTKCEFLKEVPLGNKSTTLQAYLLISTKDGKYQITGESDRESDGRLGFRLNLGREQAIAEPVARLVNQKDSISGESSKLPAAISNSKFLKEFQTFLSGDIVITMPKMYVAVAAGALIVTTVLLMVFRRPSRKKPFETNNGGERKMKSARNSVQDLNEDQQFISFVLTLFDPLFFYVLSIDKANPSTPVEMEFRHKETICRFAIQCKYLGAEVPEKIRLASLEGYQRYEAEKKIDLYLIAGAGGEPTNPKEIYLFPCKLLEEEMSYNTIMTYRKWGMFFYNSNLRKLQ